MTEICATESVSLDGVMQGLGRADEDTRGGFVHGGWGAPYQDQVMGEFMSEGMDGEGVMLFGRRTYDDVMRAWTSLTGPITDHLVGTQKYVVSRDEATPLAYPNSTLLPGEAVDTVTALKKEHEGSITIIGSGELVRALHAAGLVDSFVLLIHPITLGSGTRLFGEADRRDLRLERSVVTSTGVIIAQYAVERR